LPNYPDKVNVLYKNALKAAGKGTHCTDIAWKRPLNLRLLFDIDTAAETFLRHLKRVCFVLK